MNLQTEETGGCQGGGFGERCEDSQSYNLPKISLKIEMGKNALSVQNVYWSMRMNTTNRKKNDEIE